MTATLDCACRDCGRPAGRTRARAERLCGRCQARHRRLGQLGGGDRGGSEGAMTFAGWAADRGYDPKTRTYR